MKIVIQTTPHPKTGKGKFVQRLIPALHKHGIEVTNDICAKGDIALHIGRVHYRSNCRKNILRLGPAHVDTSQKYKRLNKEKWKSVKQADAIIYQSKYSRKVCRKFIGKTSAPSTIIFNGADQKEFDVMPYSSSYKYNFLASTRKWIAQKRLKTICCGYGLASIQDSCLWVCGDTLGKNINMSDKSLNREIKHLGNVDSKTLAKLYKLCDAMIHPIYLDACPNSVVEALVAGCPVIMTDQGGTSELINGYMNEFLIQDKPYNYKPINLSKPPYLDPYKLVEKMRLATHLKLDFDVCELKIQTVAEKYIDFFKKIL